MKKLNLNKTVYELTEQYPELIEVLYELVFKAIKNLFARKTMGIVMTIPKGCEQQGRSLDEVLIVLKEKGFEAI